MSDREISRLVRNETRVRDARDTWIKVFHYLTYTGADQGRLQERFDMRFGCENWLPAHFVDGLVESRFDGYLMYEEAYYQFLNKNADIRMWLVSTANEIYDIHPSNVASGLDYTIQECAATHLQDIAIRRALTRLVLEEQGVSYDADHLPTIQVFHGDHLVQIRERTSEGYVLSPGQVPFHKPELILGEYRNSWWKRDSVEDFYQRNKVLLVHPDALLVRLALMGKHNYWFVEDEISKDYLEFRPAYYMDRLFWTRGRTIRQEVQARGFSGYCEVKRFGVKTFAAIRNEILEHEECLRGALSRKRITGEELVELMERRGKKSILLDAQSELN